MKYLIEYENIFSGKRARRLCTRQTLIELLEKEYITIYNTRLINTELDNVAGIGEINITKGIWEGMADDKVAGTGNCNNIFNMHGSNSRKG